MSAAENKRTDEPFGPLDRLVAKLPAPAGMGPWRFLFVCYLRLNALIWLFAGVLQWARLVGFLEWGNLHFWEMPMEMRTPIVLFAVLDLVAAVGLWLGVSWGPVMWLFAILCQVVTHTVFSDLYGMPVIKLVLIFCSVVGFGVLFWRSDRESRG